MDLEKKLVSLQEVSKCILSKILNTSPVSKYLIIEPSIIKPLERVCGVKWLKGNGVEKIFKLDNRSSFDSKAIFYMIYSDAKIFKQVVDQIRSTVDVEKPPANKFHIIIIPNLFHAFERELEELGLLHACIKLHPFQWLPLHLDVGVLSLEIPNMFSELYVHQDLSSLSTYSKSLWQLFLIMGKPKFMITLGEYSKKILNEYDTLCEDKGDSDKLDSDCGGLILIDRSVDYPSVLLTPGIYSALLKEVYTIYSGTCDWKTIESPKVDNKFNPIVARQPVNFSLNSKQDLVYASIKNTYFTEATYVLNNLTKELKMEQLNFSSMSLEEMKQYTQTQLASTNSRKKYISNHLLAAETILNVLGSRYENQSEIEYNIMKNIRKSYNISFLEELMSVENDELNTMRLFCLLLITQKLTESEIKIFWRKYIHQFGFKHNYTFQNIIDAGFLPDTNNINNLQNKLMRMPKFTSNQFYANANRLKQIPPDRDKIDLKYPTCPSYVFRGGYIPLVAQITNMMMNSTPLEEIKTKLEAFGTINIRNNKAYPIQPRTLLVCIIGGITYAEIAVCNFIETLTGTKIITLSDQIISGNDLMKSFMNHPK